jgi:hypothetical protein
LLDVTAGKRCSSRFPLTKARPVNQSARQRAWVKSLLSGCIHPEDQTLLIECSPGTIVVIGPKAWEFYKRFCSDRVASVKAVSKVILVVTMELRSTGTT